MGHIHSKKAKDRHTGKTVGSWTGGLKVYTEEELYTLNVFLSQREFLLADPRPTRVVGDYYIHQTEDGVDWMARKEVNGFRKMFQLESWKRFNWGVKPLKHPHERRSSKLPYPRIRTDMYGNTANEKEE